MTCGIIPRAALLLQNQILEAGTKINEQIFNRGDEIIKEKPEGQISAVAMLVPGVQDVDAPKLIYPVMGELSKLYILVRPGRSPGGR